MTPITVLNKGNVPTGPFTRAQVAEKLQSGEFSLDSLAFVEGLSQWTPLRDVLAKVDGAFTPPPPVSPALPAVAVSPASPPAYSYAATMQPPTHLAYGGFWLRFVAYLIDSLIISAVVFVAAFFVALFFMMIGALIGANFSQMTSSNSENANPATVVLMILMELVIWGMVMVLTWLYFAKLESGPEQATYGKRVMGLRVTDLAGQRIGFGRATGRFFGKFISGMILEIGFIMAGFTERKQALHDMIAGTLVVRN